MSILHCSSMQRTHLKVEAQCYAVGTWEWDKRLSADRHISQNDRKRETLRMNKVLRVRISSYIRNFKLTTAYNFGFSDQLSRFDATVMVQTNSTVCDLNF